MREAYLSGCDLQIGSTQIGADAHLPQWENAVIILGAVASLVTLGELFLKIHRVTR